ncbi:2-isopropylmalate synthase [Actinoplanes sp. TBRC 11911]|nr:2-isopropylmalate synthase [Actinoplanes sp. TBRC 11911]
MPVGRYLRNRIELPSTPLEREWPGKTVERAPLWASVDLRDGNQSLADPMDAYRKGAMFDVLVGMGFKDIEVGYPAASAAEFSFVRTLITEDRIPDDVTISVFTPAKPDLIARTFEAIQGCDRAMVHLCMATACLWRDVVFQLSPDELERVTVAAAGEVVRLADAMPGRIRFEYSPETFNVTEPDFALRMSNRVADLWDACPDRPVTLNLPTTVETDSPNFYADQIEWMHRNLDNRSSIILSVHPHNDRGTAVASAELAVMAGADRVEGTLFGNGERTGNVCLATLALNLFSHGLDPQLDFSHIDDIRRTVEECNQMPVPARHPYAGELVFTAFSGTHQDAIAKGFAAVRGAAERAGRPVGEQRWEVPYLPLDPHDVGRTYESVVRVNSQSGKGGIAHLLAERHGLDLPRDVRVEFARVVQRVTDESGVELNSRRLWEIFRDEYLQPHTGMVLKDAQTEKTGDGYRVEALVALPDGREMRVGGTGGGVGSAFAAALSGSVRPIVLQELSRHLADDGVTARTAAYVRVTADDEVVWGVGLAEDPGEAELGAILSAVNRAVRA